MELTVLKVAVGQVQKEYAFSERRACVLLTLAVSSYRYESRRSEDGLRDRLVELAREKPRFGYRRLHVLLRRSGDAKGTANGSRISLKLASGRGWSCASNRRAPSICVIRLIRSQTSRSSVDFGVIEKQYEPTSRTFQFRWTI